VRGAFCPAAGQLEVREWEAPRPAPGEVVVRVRACGICGSDLHWFTGGGPPRVCPGHEFVGEVATLGAGVSGFRPGDRVAGEPLRSCGICDRCGRGDYHLCAHLEILGMHRQGGMAEEVTVQVEHLYRLPADLPMRTAGLTEALAVCVHAARLAPIGLGDRVLVLGSGSIGLLAIAAARAAGAAEVWATARHPHQAAAARALGAARVFAGAADAERELAALAREHAVDVVVETVGGSADTLTTAVHCARPGGVVVVLGVFLSRPALDALSLMMKEVRLIGSIVYNRNAGKADFAVAVDLLAARQSELAPLITHCFALDAVQEAFTTAAAKSSGAIKVIVEP